MSVAGAFTYPSGLMVVAACARCLRSSSHLLAWRTATITSASVSVCVANCGLVTSAFSGWLVQMSWVVMAVKPTLCATATAFQGSPTQKPSMVPTFMFATICGGGIGMMLTALGSTFAALSQYRSHVSCVPPGKVIAMV